MSESPTTRQLESDVGDVPLPAAEWDDAAAGLADLDELGVIVTANTMFLAMTGLSSTDLGAAVRWVDLLSVGNRLFYETQVQAVLHLEGSIAEVMVDISNRAGGTLPALFNAHALRDQAGLFRGTRIAVTPARDRRRFETALLEARAVAEQASEDSSRDRRRLEVQASATAALASSTDPVAAVERLAEVFVPGLADWCLIYIRDPKSPATPMRWVTAHADVSGQVLTERIAQIIPLATTDFALFAQIQSGAPATLIAEIGPDHLDAATTDTELRGLLDRVGTASAIVAPSHARGERVAVLILVRGPRRAPFTAEDRDDVAEVSARTGIVIDNTRRYAREHDNSMTLQQSLLTAPPPIPELDIEVRYLPAQDEAQVGGDWYDAYVQADGVPVIAIGDVIGHNIRAAATMGQLRGIIRTIGYTSAQSPSSTLSLADHTARGLGTAAIASAILARIDTRPDTAPGALMTWSNAGHPPPMLLSNTGTVTILESRTDLLLGVEADRPRHDHVTTLSPGDTLLLYTDGLVERAYEHLDDGLARLEALLAGQHTTSIDSLCDRIIHGLGTAHDDIALLAVRLRDTARPRV